MSKIIRIALVFVAAVSGIPTLRFRSSKKELNACMSVTKAFCVENTQLDANCPSLSFTRDVNYDCQIYFTCCIPRPDGNSDPTLANETPKVTENQLAAEGLSPVSSNSNGNLALGDIPVVVADPVVTDDPIAHTAIWFHGMQTPMCRDGKSYCGCKNLKEYIGYKDRTDVITPVSTPDHGGDQGSAADGKGTCYLWNAKEESFGPDTSLPKTNELTVSGYSLGRRPFFRFLLNHGEHVRRAVLFDPSYEYEKYDDKIGFKVVADWLSGDSNRVFVFAYGGATLSLGIKNWKETFLSGKPEYEKLRPQVFVARDRSVGHGDIPKHYYKCLFDNKCGGLVLDNYSMANVEKDEKKTK